jgi:hypothetical protein
LHKIPASAAPEIKQDNIRENIFWCAAAIASILCLKETLVRENLLTAAEVVLVISFWWYSYLLPRRYNTRFKRTKKTQQLI